MAGIYVHIPFCKSKCSYCDFTSFPDKLCYAESYMACIFREMSFRRKELKNYAFETLYIGGGTPSVVDESYIAMLTASARKNFNLAKDAEITIELNPGTVTREKIELYKKCGINRFSVGLQTAIDSQLEDIGRAHSAADFKECANFLKGENFSADVLIGLKGQTAEDVVYSINCAAQAGASHISMYALTPEDGTPIYTDYLNGELPSSDDVAALYEAGFARLKQLGFVRYEVSNFCKHGKESRHNLNYWRRGEYIGFGVSASSCINNVRFTNTLNLDEYFKCIFSDRLPVVNSEEIDVEGQKFETVMLALRTAKGLNASEYQKKFGANFFEEHAEALKKIGRYLDISPNAVRIKEEYLFVQNTIISEFLEA